MDPFNIVVKRAGKQLALNIHPKNSSAFMVLFEGSLVGQVFLDPSGKIWSAVSADNLVATDNQYYLGNSSTDCEGLFLEKMMVEKIGMEISRNLGIMR